MNIPMQWIKKYCPQLNVDAKAFADRMTMTGTMVERYYTESDGAAGIVAARVTSIKKHPDADKLLVCRADAGDCDLTVVTGAQNLAEGDIVPLAQDGATLPGGKQIRAGELRGIVSEGMFCSLGELGLSALDYPECAEDGIMVLPQNTPLGADVLALLGLTDDIFEFEITSNRPDCLCVSGIAREAAVSFDIPFEFPAPKQVETSGDVAEFLSVANETPENCQRYSAAIVDNVRVKPSPEWLRRYLRQSGVRPINNIVDITNFVMLEYNQPMHAFDHKHVNGKKIVVRQAQPGETITTLDDVKRTLSPDMMVIADEQSPIAVAGVMGGEKSGIYDDTKTVVFESACFNGLNVRATAKALGMRTEASLRYEKGLDPENTIPALMRALELVAELDAGDIVGGIADVKGSYELPRAIKFDAARVNALLGTALETQQMVDILTSLEFSVDSDLNVTPPGFRRDATCLADLAEEIARIYGYENIPSTVMTGIAAARPTERQRFSRTAADYLVGAGLFEINTFSFMSPKALDALGLSPDDARRNAVVISNPLGEDTSLMRTTAVPAMLDVLAHNYNARIESAALFEQCAVFIPKAQKDELPDELPRLVIGMYGPGNDFFALKGAVEGLLAAMGAKTPIFEPTEGDGSYHPGRAATINIDGRAIGVIGEVHPAVLENFDIAARCAIADIDMAALFGEATEKKTFHSLPRLPAVTRDLALVCDLHTLSSSIERVIERECGALLEQLEVFDVYTGPGVPDGKKSIAYSLLLRDSEKTLTDEQADDVVARALDALKKDGVVLRS